MARPQEHAQRGHPGGPAATLSACVIARDEEERLPACLASVAFCDEIVVVDSGSRDRTVAVARAAGARVVEHPWRGFSAQRNVALDHARSDWILEIDADERVSPELRAEVLAFLAAPPDGVDLGGVPIRDLFLGAPLGPSSKYPKYRHRLFRRGAYRHDELRAVHEGILPVGPVHAFTGDLVHELAGSWAEALRDTWSYARLEATHIGGTPSLGACARGLVARPLVKLAYRLAVDGGWRDGWRGVVKIGLEAGSDSLVWALHLARGGRSGAGAGAGAHFGLRTARSGPVRLVGFAARGRGAGAAAAWLAQARDAGADVALLSDAPKPEAVLAAHGVPVRSLRSVSWLALVRGLTAEEQLRPIDALVPFGRRARWLVRCLPPDLRGATDAVAASERPADAERRVRAAIREAPTGPPGRG